MRIFKTLFSEEGIPDELRGAFWLRLSDIIVNEEDW